MSISKLAKNCHQGDNCQSVTNYIAEPTSGWNERLESVISSLYVHTFTVVMLTGQQIMILGDFFFREGLTHSDACLQIVHTKIKEPGHESKTETRKTYRGLT